MRENKGTKDKPPTQNTALPTKRQWEKGHKQIHRLYSEEGVIGLQMGQGYIVAQSQSIRGTLQWDNISLDIVSVSPKLSGTLWEY